MEVKDVLKFDPTTNIQTVAHPSVKNTPASETSKNPDSKTDQITLTSNTDVEKFKKDIETKNSVITTANVLSELTNHVGEVLSKVAGVVEEGGVAPKDKASDLEKEGNALVSSTAKIISATAQQINTALKDAPIDKAIEKSIAQVLDVLLPGDSEDSTVLSTVKFSPKESIIATHLALTRSLQKFEELQKSVTSITEAAKKISSELTGQKETPHGQPTVRGLDGVTKLSDQTLKIITNEPGSALNAIGSLSAAHAVNRI